MISISAPVLANLTTETLRQMQVELLASVEALRADDIKPAKGVTKAIMEIHDVLVRREA